MKSFVWLFWTNTGVTNASPENKASPLPTPPSCTLNAASAVQPDVGRSGFLSCCGRDRVHWLPGSPWSLQVHSLCSCLFQDSSAGSTPATEQQSRLPESSCLSMCELPFTCWAPALSTYPLPTSVSVWGFLVYHPLGSGLSGLLMRQAWRAGWQVYQRLCLANIQ